LDQRDENVGKRTLSVVAALLPLWGLAACSDDAHNDSVHTSELRVGDLGLLVRGTWDGDVCVEVGQVSACLDDAGEVRAIATDTSEWLVLITRDMATGITGIPSSRGHVQVSRTLVLEAATTSDDHLCIGVVRGANVTTFQLDAPLSPTGGPDATEVAADGAARC
jgi:hypothetical protein